MNLSPARHEWIPTISHDFDYIAFPPFSDNKETKKVKEKAFRSILLIYYTRDIIIERFMESGQKKFSYEKDRERERAKRRSIYLTFFILIESADDETVRPKLTSVIRIYTSFEFIYECFNYALIHNFWFIYRRTDTFREDLSFFKRTLETENLTFIFALTR